MESRRNRQSRAMKEEKDTLVEENQTQKKEKPAQRKKARTILFVQGSKNGWQELALRKKVERRKKEGGKKSKQEKEELNAEEIRYQIPEREGAALVSPKKGGVTKRPLIHGGGGQSDQPLPRMGDRPL